MVIEIWFLSTTVYCPFSPTRNSIIVKQRTLEANSVISLIPSLYSSPLVTKCSSSQPFLTSIHLPNSNVESFTRAVVRSRLLFLLPSQALSPRNANPFRKESVWVSSLPCVRTRRPLSMPRRLKLKTMRKGLWVSLWWMTRVYAVIWVCCTVRIVKLLLYVLIKDRVYHDGYVFVSHET